MYLTGTITNATPLIELGALKRSKIASNANLYCFTTQGAFLGATVSLQYSIDGGINKTALNPLVTNHTDSTETEFNVHNNNETGLKTYYLVTTGATSSTSIKYMIQSADGESD